MRLLVNTGWPTVVGHSEVSDPSSYFNISESLNVLSHQELGGRVYIWTVPSREEEYASR